jgi:hypothetical protein
MDEATKLLLEDILHQIQTNRKEVKEDIALQATAISGRVDAKIDEKLGEIKLDVQELLAHNQRQNGWIKDHNERLDDLDGKEGVISRLEIAAAACQSHRHGFKKAAKNWKWLLAAVILGFFLLHSLFDIVNVGTIIQWVTKMIL